MSSFGADLYKQYTSLERGSNIQPKVHRDTIVHITVMTHHLQALLYSEDIYRFHVHDGEGRSPTHHVDEGCAIVVHMVNMYRRRRSTQGRMQVSLANVMSLQTPYHVNL